MRGIVVYRILAITLVFIILAATSYFLLTHSTEQKDLIVHTAVPQFTFINQDSVAYGSDNMSGKITVVDFIFTRCKGPCPLMAENMRIVYDTFYGNDKVQIVSISVDPEYDSLEVLKQYAIDKGVTDDRWNFLRADIESVVDVCENGFKLAAEDLPGAHSTKFVLVDELLNIRGYYSGVEIASVEQMIEDIKVLSAE